MEYLLRGLIIENVTGMAAVGASALGAAMVTLIGMLPMAKPPKSTYTVPQRVWDMYPDVARMVTTLGLDAHSGARGMVLSGSDSLISAFVMAYPGIVNHHTQYGQPSVDALDQKSRERLKDVRANTPRAAGKLTGRATLKGSAKSRRRIVLPEQDGPG